MKSHTQHWPVPTTRRATSNRVLPLLACGLSLAFAGAARAGQVWTANGATKIRPGSPLPAKPSGEAGLAAAKNEFEAFQVVVSGPATGISMAFEGLSDGHGNTITGRDVTLYRQALMNLTLQSGGDGATGWWPDALVPDVDPVVGEKRNAFPFDVPAGENRAVYVDVHVPQDAPAGTYRGVVEVRGSITATVPVTLLVWDFAMPSTATLKSAFGLAWNGPCLGHGDAACGNRGYELPLRARYVQAMLDNRVSVSAPSTSGPVANEASPDWSGFDQYAGPFLDGTANTRLKGARLTGVQVEGWPVTTGRVKGFADHFKQKGWFPALFNYVCDEPPATCAWTDIPRRIADSRAADPQVPTLVTTQPYTAAANGVSSGVDLFVAGIDFMENRPGTPQAGNQRSRWPANVWLYQGCGSFGCSGFGPGVDPVATSGWPSYAIDTDATRNRALEWMSYIFDASGELYYETTQGYFGGADPWVSQYAFGGNGDGTLVYPGTTNRIGGQTEIPVESLRLKGIRDGMEDYELLIAAKALGFGEQAKQIALGLFPHAYEATTSTDALYAARDRLAALVLKGLGKDAPSSSPATGAAESGTVSTPKTGLSSLGYPGGCSTRGAQGAWLALPLVALVALRRRRRR